MADWYRLVALFLPPKARTAGEHERDWVLQVEEWSRHLEFAHAGMIRNPAVALGEMMCCPLAGVRGGTSSPELANGGSLVRREDMASLTRSRS